jgi:hypothetical protein
MRLRTALASAILAFAFAGASVLTFTAVTTQAAAAKPSVRITSVSSSGTCVTIKVAVSHFKLVQPVYKPPIPLLKGNQGHIHYTLNGKILPTRDATTKLSHTFCGNSQFVKKGMNVVSVYLATSTHTLFPGTTPSTKKVMVK